MAGSGDAIKKHLVHALSGKKHNFNFSEERFRAEGEEGVAVDRIR